MKLLLEEMTREEARAAFDQGAIVVLPTASIEQHGPHLPLVTDTAVVDAIARGAAERARSRDVPVVVAPVVHYGCSHHHLPWAGTMSLTTETYVRVLTDLCRCLAHHGVKKILLLNGHGGNHEANRVVAREMVNEADLAVAASSYWTLAAPLLQEAQSSQVGPTPGHAGGFETSCMLALRPDIVDAAKIARRPAGEAAAPENRITGSSRAASVGDVYVARAGAFERAGGTSDDASRASAEAGRRFLDAAVAATADFLVSFRDS